MPTLLDKVFRQPPEPCEFYTVHVVNITAQH